MLCTPVNEIWLFGLVFFFSTLENQTHVIFFLFALILASPNWVPSILLFLTFLNYTLLLIFQHQFEFICNGLKWFFFFFVVWLYVDLELCVSVKLFFALVYFAMHLFELLFKGIYFFSDDFFLLINGDQPVHKCKPLRTEELYHRKMVNCGN